MPIPTDLNIFGLLGQSNMVGRATLPSPVPVYNDVYEFANDYTWKAALEPVDSNEGQIDTVSSDSGAAYGLSARFANTLKNRMGGGASYPVGLVPCAKVSTTIAEWGIPTDHFDRSTLYGSAMYRMQQARQYGSIKGILFFQGESDSFKELIAHEWAANFAAIVDGIRADLELPDLPIVYAVIGKWAPQERPSYFSLIQSQQQFLDIAHTAYILSADLELGDEAHYTRASYDVLGDRFAAAMAALL